MLLRPHIVADVLLIDQDLVDRAPGLSGDSVYGQLMGAAQRGITGAGGATDWEIGQLYQSGRLGGMGLYQDGQYVPNGP